MSADGGSRCHRKEHDQGGRTRPRRHLLFLLGSVVAAALVLSATASSASALDLGLNWSGSYAEGESAAEMDAVQHSGAKYFRQQLSWGYKKEHGWGPYDKVFGLAAERGITILPYLYGRENGSPQFPEKGEYPAWETWVYEVINRYGYGGDFWVGKSYAKPVDVWEVWNEPNLKRNNPGGATVQPKLFGNFLKRTSNAIKAAQQARAPGHVGTTVVMGGLMKVVSGIGNIEPFLLGVNEETGATASYDALGLHPYEFETPNHITELNGTLSFARWVLNNKVAGSSKPIWITELGWPVEYGEAGKSQQVTEAEQASLLTQAFDLIKAHAGEYNIPTAIWYSYHDIPVGEWAYHCGLRKADGTYRPSWYAFEEEAGAAKWPTEEELSASTEEDYSPGPRTVIDPTNNVIHVFYRTPSGGLGHNVYIPWEGHWYSEVLPGSVASDPHVIIDKSSSINVFYRTPSGGLGHSVWNGSSWTSEVLAGEVASEPHALIDPTNNVIHVFYRTPSGGLGHSIYVPWEGHWSNEVLAGSLAAEPHAFIEKTGGINVFYRTPSGGLGHAAWGGSGWGIEVLAGEVASEPHAVIDPTNNVIHVFYRTPSGGLGHNIYIPWEGHWYNEVLSGSLASDPHPMADKTGGLNVFYRTPSGGLGHAAWGGSAWGIEVLGGEVAARPPAATTGAASAIGSGGATVEGTVNPEGTPTKYYFEYGLTTSYGSQQPASGKEIGYAPGSVTVKETLAGLNPSTIYHYRLVATSSEGTTKGLDKTFTTQAGTGTGAKLAAMPVTEPFDGSTESNANFGSKWSALGWAAGTTPKGVDTTGGWGPSSAYSTINGAYYTTALTGAELAAVATMATNPGNTLRYFSLLLDMPTPASTRAGYELRFIDTATNVYEVTLSKWVSGTQTVLATKTGYSFVNGNSLAIVDQGGTVSAWADTGSGFNQLLSATDSAFSSGNAGLHGAGNVTRLTKFKAGSL